MMSVLSGSLEGLGHVAVGRGHAGVGGGGHDRRLISSWLAVAGRRSGRRSVRSPCLSPPVPRRDVEVDVRVHEVLLEAQQIVELRPAVWAGDAVLPLEGDERQLRLVIDVLPHQERCVFDLDCIAEPDEVVLGPVALRDAVDAVVDGVAGDGDGRRRLIDDACPYLAVIAGVADGFGQLVAEDGPSEWFLRVIPGVDPGDLLNGLAVELVHLGDLENNFRERERENFSEEREELRSKS